MSEQKVLTQEQVDNFHRDGFVLVRELYSAAEIQQISDWTDEVAAKSEEPGKQMMYFESSQTDGGRILWLQGTPGCTGRLGRIRQIAPYSHDRH
jgi:hypothetical protein